MDSESALEREEVRLASAMWRHRWLVALVVAVFLGLGFLASQALEDEYEAVASLIVRDPRASSLDFTDLARASTQSSERYLADQVAILRSTEAATIALDLMDGEFDLETFVKRRSVQGDFTSNLIEISFTDQLPEVAKRGADSLLAAYPELRRRQAQESATAALARLDALSETIEEELSSIGERIVALAGGDEDRIELQSQFDAAVRRLADLRDRRASVAVGTEAREAINQEILELLTDFETWRVVLDIKSQDGQLAALVAQQASAIDERATLVARRNTIAVDAELAAGGIELSSPARLPTDPTGFGDPTVLAGSVALGLAVAAALSYSLIMRRRRLATIDVAERVLKAPLLARIPDFTIEGIKSPLPVEKVPASAVAEAYRFAAGAIDLRAAASKAVSVSFVSATVGAGKTATIANTAIAAAREGRRTLLIDGDLGNQGLTRMLVQTAPQRGIADVVQKVFALDEALVDISPGPKRSLALLSRGFMPFEPGTFFQSEQAKRLFSSLRERFDLILIDSPPMLQVAYASTLASYADSAVVLVEHLTPTQELDDLADRLDLIGTPVLGYVYTKAPIRMVDVPGTSGRTGPGPTGQPKDPRRVSSRPPARGRGRRTDSL